MWERLFASKQFPLLIYGDLLGSSWDTSTRQISDTVSSLRKTRVGGRAGLHNCPLHSSCPQTWEVLLAVDMRSILTMQTFGGQATLNHSMGWTTGFCEAGAGFCSQPVFAKAVQCPSSGFFTFEHGGGWLLVLAKLTPKSTGVKRPLWSLKQPSFLLSSACFPTCKTMQWNGPLCFGGGAMVLGGRGSFTLCITTHFYSWLFFCLDVSGTLGLCAGVPPVLSSWEMHLGRHSLRQHLGSHCTRPYLLRSAVSGWSIKHFR